MLRVLTDFQSTLTAQQKFAKHYLNTDLENVDPEELAKTLEHQVGYAKMLKPQQKARLKEFINEDYVDTLDDYAYLYTKKGNLIYVFRTFDEKNQRLKRAVLLTIYPFIYEFQEIPWKKSVEVKGRSNLSLQCSPIEMLSQLKARISAIPA